MPTPRSTIALFIASGVVASLHIGKVPVALPVLRDALGLGLVQSGALVSLFNIVGLFAALPLGALADRAGHRRWTIAGLALLGAGSLAGAAAPGAPALLAARLVEGTGFILVVTAVPALLVRATRPETRALVFGVWSGYMPAGAALVMLVAPLMLPHGWRPMWAIAGAATLALAALVALCTRHGHDRRQATAAAQSVWHNVQLTLSAPGPLLLAAIFASYTYQLMAVLTFLPMLLAESLGATPARAALLTAAVVAANVPGNLMGGALLQRRVPRWKLVLAGHIGVGLAAPFIYAAGLPGSARYAACIVLTFCGGFIPATVLGSTTAFAPRPDLIASTNGLASQGSNLGHTVGPPLCAAIVTAGGGFHVAPFALAPAAALGCLLALGLRRAERARVTTSLRRAA